MDKNIIKVGPWGGSGGNKWYDGNFNGVREITIRAGIYIDSIMVVYDKNGMPVTGDQHGGSGGKAYTITLRYPEEYLTAVSGYITIPGSPVICSLRLESNQRSFGPFGGAEKGTPFSCPMDGGLIVGFLGRSGLYLDAIGFACAPVNIIYEKILSQNET